MTPREIYRRMVAKIKPADVRLVAACFEDHIGAENAVLMPQLCARTGLHERVVRNILNTLVTEYGIPIGAQSGKAGRWIIADEPCAVQSWSARSNLRGRRKRCSTSRKCAGIGIVTRSGNGVDAD